MTIAHEASTGIDVASSPLGSTSSVTPYVGVAAGRMALLFVAVQPSTATFGADPAGWTKLGERAGGENPHTSGGTASNNPNKIGVWYRTLTGSETGNVTVTNSGGDACAGCMSSYSTTGSWATPTGVSGDDSTHGADRSVTCASWTIAAGDTVVAAYSSDRAATTALTAQSFTQSGATFGTVTHRNLRLGNTSFDCGAYTFDAPVTGGSTGAVTVAFSVTATQCGPAMAVRLQETGAATNAPAAAATGTGAANNAAGSVKPPAGTSGTGAAHNASTLIGAAATNATAVAAALTPSLSVRVSAECATGAGTAYPAVFAIPSHPAGPRITATSPRGRISTSTTPPITSTSPRGWL